MVAASRAPRAMKLVVPCCRPAVITSLAARNPAVAAIFVLAVLPFAAIAAAANQNHDQQAAIRYAVFATRIVALFFSRQRLRRACDRQRLTTRAPSARGTTANSRLFQSVYLHDHPVLHDQGHVSKLQAAQGL